MWSRGFYYFYYSTNMLNGRKVPIIPKTMMAYLVQAYHKRVFW